MVEDENEDEILTQALGRVGGVAGALGGGLAGFLGGLFGGRLGALLTKKVSQEAELTLQCPLSAASERVRNVLAELAQPTAHNLLGPVTDQTKIMAVAGGGFGDLNPVVITIRLTSHGRHSTTLEIRTAAKEGLIKQRSAEKTMNKLVRLLQHAHA
ncbi:hypothetical protein [Streptomyces collinus]|uniref:hypothetical protein n=1 Tax=Streptomyces collinus TaxID=42684 RepID=UPI00294221D9|nr:hypothetical protein [Streptomyces collinus]